MCQEENYFNMLVVMTLDHKFISFYTINIFNINLCFEHHEVLCQVEFTCSKLTVEILE